MTPIWRGWRPATHAREFTAMITAVRAWAETQKGWDHPLKAIKDELLKKSRAAYSRPTPTSRR